MVVKFRVFKLKNGVIKMYFLNAKEVGYFFLKIITYTQIHLFLEYGVTNCIFVKEWKSVTYFNE